MKYLLLVYTLFGLISCAETDSDNGESFVNVSDNGTSFNVKVNYGKYLLDETSSKTIKLMKGNTYYFNLSDSSTDNHPFFISTSSSGGNYDDEYISGITNSRETSGTLTFIVPSNLTSSLYYNCGAHSGMGGVIMIE